MRSFGVLPAQSVVVTDPELAELMAGAIAYYVKAQLDIGVGCDPRLHAVLVALDRFGSVEVPQRVLTRDDEAPDTSQWWSVKETVEVVGVDESYVRRLVRDGHLHGVRVRGAYKINPSTVEAFRVEREAKAKA